MEKRRKVSEELRIISFHIFVLENKKSLCEKYGSCCGYPRGSSNRDFKWDFKLLSIHLRKNNLIIKGKNLLLIAMFT